MVYFPHFDHFGHLEGKFLQENHSFLDSGLIPTIFHKMGNFVDFTQFHTFREILAILRVGVRVSNLLCFLLLIFTLSKMCNFS